MTARRALRADDVRLRLVDRVIPPIMRPALVVMLRMRVVVTDPARFKGRNPVRMPWTTVRPALRATFPVTRSHPAGVVINLRSSGRS